MQEDTVSVNINDPLDTSSFKYSTFVKLLNIWNDWTLDKLFETLCNDAKVFKTSGGPKALAMGLRHVVVKGLDLFCEKAVHTVLPDTEVSLIKGQYNKIISLQFVVISQVNENQKESSGPMPAVVDPPPRKSSILAPMFLNSHAKCLSNNEKSDRDAGDRLPLYRKEFVMAASRQNAMTLTVTKKDKTGVTKIGNISYC